ncbi:MAG: ComEC/Rec2 family competence protein [bacterium JZ-2024 1]
MAEWAGYAKRRVPVLSALYCAMLIVVWDFSAFVVPLSLCFLFLLGLFASIYKRFLWVWVVFVFGLMMALRLWMEMMWEAETERKLTRLSERGNVVEVEGVLGPYLYANWVKRSEYRLYRFYVKKVEGEEVYPVWIEALIYCPAPCGSIYSGLRIRFFASVLPGRDNFSFLAFQECPDFQNCKGKNPPQIVEEGLLAKVKKRWLLFARKTYGCMENPLYVPCRYMGLIFGTEGLWVEWGEERKQYTEMVHTFRHLGLVHLIVPSGSHLSVFLFVLLLLDARFLRRFRLLFYSFCIGVLMLIAHLFDGVSMLRAFFLAVVSLWSRFFYLPRDSVNELALVGIGLLLFQPDYLRHPTFQLTFSASVGMMLFSSFVEREWVIFPGWLRKTFGVNLGPSLFLTPVLSGLSGAVPIFAPLCNSSVLLLSWVILFGGICSGLFLFFPSFSAFLLWVLVPFFFLLDWWVILFLRLPEPLWWVPYFPVWMYVLAFVIFFFSVEFLRFGIGKRIYWVSTILGFLVVLLFPVFRPEMYVATTRAKPVVMLPWAGIMIGQPEEGEFSAFALLAKRMHHKKVKFLLQKGNWSESLKGKVKNAFVGEGMEVEFLWEECGQRKEDGVECRVFFSPSGEIREYSIGKKSLRILSGKGGKVLRVISEGISLCWSDGGMCSGYIQLGEGKRVQIGEEVYEEGKVLGIYRWRKGVAVVEVR